MFYIKSRSSKLVFISLSCCLIISITFSTIICGSAIAPTPDGTFVIYNHHRHVTRILPVSPHASCLLMGSMTWKRKSSRRTPRWRAVKGWFHILVFIAGHTITGFEGSHARKTHVWLCPSWLLVQSNFIAWVSYQQIITQAIGNLSQCVCI